MELPHDFAARTRQWLGDAYPLLENALQEEAPVSIRIHPAKCTIRPAYEQVEWCSTGFYLPVRPAFTFDPCFHAGVYYVQEASSMFLEQAIRQYVSAAPAVCLDLCAAPGGKSTHLLNLLPEKSLLVCNEVIRSRCAVLTENILKWGSPYAIVTGSDAGQIGQLTHLFDVIVADLPCSGEGMFRKDANSCREWSIAGVQRCAARQRRIIRDVWTALRPGGLLVYSTCTLNREENEDNIRHIVETLDAEVLPLSVDGVRSRIQEIAPDGGFPVYRFFPHRIKGEGFFLAVLRKPGGERKVITRKVKHKPPAGLPQIRGWLTENERYRIETDGTLIHAIPCEHADTYALLSERLHVLSAGIPLGGWRGRDVQPSPSLALSTSLRREAFPSVELSWEEAVRYLQREALTLPENVPAGYVLVTCQEHPLGFVKHTGRRANNLYPQEWRIRSSHRPEKAPEIIYPHCR
jgi:16S rRNA C967 or C1407 C5-methylase (RsmB/RsmF family)/NOL1/NOP2/fmu family ribosome biogenesis protein